MTLKEKVFMCELIKSSYRRRIFWFWLQVAVMTICFTCLVYLWLNGLKSTMIATISLVGIMAMILNMSRLYLSVFAPGFPWKAKQEQADTLEQIWEKVDFEDLKGYVHLKEYLEV